MAEALDLRAALEQDRQQVMELLESTRRLVLEVRAAHYWTAEAISSFNQLSKIGTNIHQMLYDLEPGWAAGKAAFDNVEAVKLYKTSIGLWAALRPVRQKFIEHLDKRRRQRIMGEDYVESTDVTPEQNELDLAEFSEKHAQLWSQFVSIGEALQAVPAGLLPSAEQIRAAQEAAKNAPPPHAAPAPDGTMPPPPPLHAPLPSTGSALPPALAQPVESAPATDSGSAEDNGAASLHAQAPATYARMVAQREPAPGTSAAPVLAPALPASPPRTNGPDTAVVRPAVDTTPSLPQGALDQQSLPQAGIEDKPSGTPSWSKPEEGSGSAAQPSQPSNPAPSNPSQGSGGSAQATMPRRGDEMRNGPRITWGGKG